MSILQQISTVVALVGGTIGLFAGFLTVTRLWKEYRASRPPIGDREVQICLISKTDADSSTEVECLVGGDIFHFLTAFTKPDLGIQVTSVEGVGEAYLVTASGPRGSFERIKIVGGQA